MGCSARRIEAQPKRNKKTERFSPRRGLWIGNLEFDASPFVVHGVFVIVDSLEFSFLLEFSQFHTLPSGSSYPFRPLLHSTLVVVGLEVSSGSRAIGSRNFRSEEKTG
ncbi:hypothetical protein DITRI_Ditri03aG0157300 [Diplodiscus trichospermus]